MRTMYQMLREILQSLRRLLELNVSKSEGEAKKDYCDELKAYYNERRKDLDTIRANSIDSFDKALLQVSTGALVVTITFIDKIGKPYDEYTHWILIFFWLLFLLVIPIIILGYWLAKKNMDFKIKDLDERYDACPDDWQANRKEGISKYKFWTEVCSFSSLGIFFLGALLFFYYAYLVQMNNFKIIMTNEKQIEKATPKEKPVKIPVDAGMTESREKPIKPPKK
jgi:hypothetical protein